MKKTLITILAATPLIWAQDRDNRPPRPLSPVIEVLDADHDEVISAEEIANAEASLASLDEDENGVLTSEELRPQPPEGGPEEPRGKRDDDSKPVMPIIEVLDTNQDGEISSDEMADAPENLLDLDANGDDELDREELRPRSEEGGGERPGGHPGGPGGPPRGPRR